MENRIDVDEQSLRGVQTTIDNVMDRLGKLESDFVDVKSAISELKSIMLSTQKSTIPTSPNPSSNSINPPIMHHPPPPQKTLPTMLPQTKFPSLMNQLLIPAPHFAKLNSQSSMEPMCSAGSPNQSTSSTSCAHPWTRRCP
ncbi:Uncharacterized protein Fot_06290 [Forsythia ovata]|uniref:Uncharacterized protein n=1 Tax=Forsythia ovata TaxID=205694 RepID=A0ABD1WSI8_9LAMI